MGRPRATAAASKTRRGDARPNQKPKPSFLSPLAAPARTRARKRAVSSPASSSPGSSSSPAYPGLSFLSSPGFSASASPNPKPRAWAKAKLAARSPLVASPGPGPGPGAATPSPATSPSPAMAAASIVGELRSAVTSQVEALKRRLDALHSRAHADLSLSRVAKRVKTQNQACQQLTDEVDKEYKKMSDNMKESSEKIKAKYKQIIADAQSSTTHVRKVTIPEMTKTVEKAIDGLRSRYNISMPA